jgi:hypothetical protein
MSLLVIASIHFIFSLISHHQVQQLVLQDGLVA